MYIGVVTTGLDIGGAEMALLRLLPALRGLGIESSVVSLRSAGAVGPRLDDAGIRVRSLGLPRPVATAGAWPRLLAFLRESPPALLHGWMYHGNLAALAAARRLGVPIVWGIRQSLGAGYRDKWLTRRVIDAGARLSGRVDRIVYNSAAARSAHEARGYAVAGGVVIPNGFNTQALRPDGAARAAVRAELGIAADAPLVAQVARYHPGKDYPTLLRAAARIVAALPAARFILVGEGVDASNAALTSPIQSLRLDAHVLMLGRRDDVPRLLAAVDVAVLTSAGEAFPNVLGEAMSCGVPCVGTAVGDVPHLIGDTGEVVPPSDAEAVAAAVVCLLSLPALERRALGARARQRIVDNFSLDRVAKAYADLLFEVAQRGR